MNKNEREAFLKKGGTLLRTGFNRDNFPIIKKRTASKDWHIHLTFESEEIAFKTMNQLATNHPDKFIIDQEMKY